jgi:hypothetical protein
MTVLSASFSVLRLPDFGEIVEENAPRVNNLRDVTRIGKHTMYRSMHSGYRRAVLGVLRDVINRPQKHCL